MRVYASPDSLRRLSISPLGGVERYRGSLVGVVGPQEGYSVPLAQSLFFVDSFSCPKLFPIFSWGIALEAELKDLFSKVLWNQ